MGKTNSAKNRRSSVKSHKELKNLRRFSLLDSATPDPKEKAKLSQSISPPSRPDEPPGENGKKPRQRIDFVLPRVPGKKPQVYVFDKKRQKDKSKKATQPTIQEDDDDNGISNILRSTETIDDILFPNRRRDSSEDSQLLGAEPMDTDSSPTKAVISGGRFMLTQALIIHDTQSTIEEMNEVDQQSPKSKNQRKLSDPISPNSLGKLSGLSVEDAVKDKYGLRPRANSTDGELKLPQRGLCDERMVLESHRWNQDQNYVHQVVPKGFVNLGNTCFLNATLQCLAYLPPFCQSILAISESKKRLSKKMKKKLSQGKRITSILSSLYKKIHSFDETSRGDAIAPHSIVKALPTIGTCGSRNGYKFRPGRQEDAHEFLVHLLDAMHDGELRAAGIDQQASGWRDRLPVPRLDETTFIHRIFGGYFRSQVRCGTCGYCSNTYDPFLDLSLEVSKKTCRSILHSLADFTSKETLDSDNRWKCSGCSKHVRATKQLTVFRPPLSLCIQLKRFSFEGGFGAKGYSAYGTRGWKYGKSNNKFGLGGKITKPIEFPGHLNVPLSDSRSCQYDLTGVVIHVGGSASSGHYTAYIKTPGRKGKDQWFHVDDSFVEPVPEKTVLRQQDAYLLFYCRKEVKLEFPSPPPQGMSAAEAMKVMRARAKARSGSIGKESPSETDSMQDMEVGSTTSSVAKTPSVVSNGIMDNSDSDSYDSDFDPTKFAESSDSDSANLEPEIDEKTFEGTTTVMKRTKAITHPLSSPTPVKKGKKSNKSESQLGQTLLPMSGSSDNVDELDSDTSDSDFEPQAQVSDEDSDSDSSPVENERDASDSSDTDDSSSGDSTSSSDSSCDDDSSSFGDSPNDDDGNRDATSVTESTSKAKVQPKIQETNGVNLPQAKSDDESSSDETASEQSSSIGDSDEPNEQKKLKEITSQSRPSEGTCNAKTLAQSSPSSEKATSRRTRVVLDSKDARGKIQVMMGPKKKQHWQSKAAPVGAKGDGFDLLGNLSVSKWDDGDDTPVVDSQAPSKNSTSTERQQIISKINKHEKSSKRKHHLDRWDAHLDQGRLKKTKADKEEKQSSMFGQFPKNNVFQKIQSSVSRMKKGKPKGFFQPKVRFASTAAGHRKSR